MFELKSKKISGPRQESRPSGEPENESLESSAGNNTMLGMLGAEKKLPDGVREKMESSFSADFSNVKVYESSAVGDMGAEAFAKGNVIGFDKGKFNPDSESGQSLLGHELSHVMQQSRGEVSSPMAKGLPVTENSALETRADREGEMAAKGQSVGLAPFSAGISSSAQPVQLKAGESKKQRKKNKEDRGRITEARGAKTSDEKVRKMTEIAYRNSMDTEVSDENADYFGQTLQGTDNGFMDSLLAYQIESSRALNQLRQKFYQEGISRGMDQETAMQAATYRAKYSPQADQLQATQSLSREMFMNDDSGEKFEYYTAATGRLRQSSPDAFAEMGQASEGILLSHDKHTRQAFGGEENADVVRDAHDEDMDLRRKSKKKWGIFG